MTKKEFEKWADQQALIAKSIMWVGVAMMVGGTIVSLYLAFKE